MLTYICVLTNDLESCPLLACVNLCLVSLGFGVKYPWEVTPSTSGLSWKIKRESRCEQELNRSFLLVISRIFRDNGNTVKVRTISLKASRTRVVTQVRTKLVFTGNYSVFTWTNQNCILLSNLLLTTDVRGGSFPAGEPCRPWSITTEELCAVWSAWLSMSLLTNCVTSVLWGLTCPPLCLTWREK